MRMSRDFIHHHREHIVLTGGFPVKRAAAQILATLRRGQPHPAQQVLEPRVVAQPVEKQTREAEDLKGALLVGLFQQRESFLLVAEAQLDDREMLRRNILIPRTLLERGQYRQGFAPSPADSIEIPLPGTACASGERCRLFERGHGFGPVALSLGRRGERRVRAGELRIDLQRLVRLLDRLVVTADAHERRTELDIDDGGEGAIKER